MMLRRNEQLSKPRLLFASIAGLAAVYFVWGLYRVLS
jgi:hypothetical protein